VYYLQTDEVGESMTVGDKEAPKCPHPKGHEWTKVSTVDWMSMPGSPAIESSESAEVFECEWCPVFKFVAIVLEGGVPGVGYWTSKRADR